MIKKLQSYISSGDSAILYATILVVNLGNYVINLLLGRWLGPELFAEAGILATSVLVLSFLGIGLQMTAAKYAAASEKNSRRLTGISRWLQRSSLLTGGLLALVLATSASGLQHFLQFQSARPFLLLAISVPIYLLMSTDRGVLQGRLQFRRLAATYLAEMGARLIITGSLVGYLYLNEKSGISAAIVLGYLASFLAAWAVGRSRKTNDAFGLAPIPKKAILQFMVVVGAYELTQIVISYSDVILVKHFFDTASSGLYTALALIGKIIYFATWSVVTLLFPKVIQMEKKGQPHLPVFYRSLTMVMLAGLAITGGCLIMGKAIILLMFGKAYLSIAPLLWKYALATTLFAGANVFVYYHLSLDRYVPVLISGLAGILQIILIHLFHRDLNAIIGVQLCLMSGLLTALIIFHRLKYLRNEKNKAGYRYALSAQ